MTMTMAMALEASSQRLRVALGERAYDIVVGPRLIGEAGRGSCR